MSVTLSEKYLSLYAGIYTAQGYATCRHRCSMHLGSTVEESVIFLLVVWTLYSFLNEFVFG